MQQSLNKNIQEVRNQTVILEARNKELLEAYEHVKEEERVKTAILHNMPDKMSASVADISMTAQKLCDEHKQLKDEEISEQVGKIEAKAQQVTEMLDELLKTAQEETHSHHVERTDVTP
jgi:K+-sensing histidine kinase KdpD